MNKQEFNQMQLEFIEHIKSVRNPYYWDTDEFLTTFKLVLNDAKREAIAEHEVKQWKKYPENKPENGNAYLVTVKIASARCGYIYAVSKDFYQLNGFVRDEGRIIAFRELPEPYRKEPQP